MMNNNDLSWQRLRSDIYIRDKGICWICNTFVNLTEYELGHLIDRCNDGKDDYDNLAVMHKSCNLSKPYHTKLEDIMRWKLTNSIPAKSFIPEAQNGRIKRATTINSQELFSTIPQVTFKRINKQPRKTKVIKQKESLEIQLSKIKPNTICWIQGRPLYKNNTQCAMWKVLPPPYNKENLFTMRVTPPGAVDNGNTGVRDSMQIIGGGDLLQDVDINIGTIHYHIFYSNGKLDVIFNSSNGNVGERSRTIGMGIGQIPIKAWHIAKSQGIKYKDFINQYPCSPGSVS